jgi:bifunctional DNase/RNase
MDVPMELSRLVITETSPEQLIFLREKNGPRSFPIEIGIHEALAIDRRLKGKVMPRPLTHDLLDSVILALGGVLERIVIHDLRDRAFLAKLVIRQNGQIIEIDCRPSDAIALGIASETPIFVAERVVAQVVSEPMDLASQKENLEFRRDQLADQIAQIHAHMEDESFRSSLTTTELHQIQQQVQDMEADLEAIEEILRQLPQ